MPELGGASLVFEGLRMIFQPRLLNRNQLCFMDIEGVCLVKSSWFRLCVLAG